MADLSTFQFLIIILIFVWSGFVRSGLGFGGAVLSLPLLLSVHPDPLFFLPILALQLLLFSGATVVYNLVKKASKNLPASDEVGALQSTVDWSYLKFAIMVMLIPKVMGVIGVITLPGDLMSGVIFCIVAVYSISYILNKPFVSNSRAIDVLFLIVGGYMLGTSLLGAPFVITVFAQRVERHQLRDTLFALWFVLVTIKLAAFVYAGVDLQLAEQLWLFPAASVGHFMGLRFHDYTLQADTKVFYQIIGSVLLVVSIVGIYQLVQ